MKRGRKLFRHKEHDEIVAKMTHWKIPRRHLQSWLLGSNRSNSKSTGIMPQKFDFLLAMDFEATCVRNQKIEPIQEIIEFPCLKIDTKNFEVTGEFHTYVKPKLNPILSDFCTELTGILQETVNDSPDFVRTLDNFQNWLKSSDMNCETSENFAVVTCGDWDLKTCLPKQCETYGINVPFWAKRWINLKRSHQIMHPGKFPRSLNEILRSNGLEFEGRPHSGIDDTKNIAKSVKALALKGHVFDYYDS